MLPKYDGLIITTVPFHVCVGGGRFTLNNQRSIINTTSLPDVIISITITQEGVHLK